MNDIPLIQANPDNDSWRFLNPSDDTAENRAKYRIRKFTPRECFRLMDVSEDAIDAIQGAGISDTQQYKMAGNSIVVSCLYHIFKSLFIESEPQQPGEQITFDF